MRLFVALRLLSEQHAKAFVEAANHLGLPTGHLIDANVGRRHPALKNICSYLISSGALPETRREKANPQVDSEREVDLRLYWCEIDTESSADEWSARQRVEMVVSKDEFTKFTASIRYKAGADYVIACEKYAHAFIHVGEPSFKSSHQSAGQAA